MFPPYTAPSALDTLIRTLDNAALRQSEYTTEITSLESRLTELRQSRLNAEAYIDSLTQAIEILNTAACLLA